uniref:Cupin domain-containing protein n=1 Tax=Candidatus Kentrum sp. MB TaxID=2138164 RepID=A0A451BFR6_9GAMM|nr:MAG: Cupin domain-containing protein [Candidatus Kentron sp. MB]
MDKTIPYIRTEFSQDDKEILRKSGFSETQITEMCDKPAYPVIGSREGYFDKITETDIPKSATASYPSWFRGTGPNSSYNDDSTYWYRWVMGPKGMVQSGLISNKISVGTGLFKPNTKYPVHNHVPWELYFILEGKGIFVKNDRRYDIASEDFIITRPYDPHAIKNTSKTKRLKFLWIAWLEEEAKLDIMSMGGRPINPKECWKDQENASLFPMPIPPVLSGRDADRYLYDATTVSDKPIYPVIGSREGYLDKITETDIPKSAAENYPTWFRGTGPNNSYDDDSTYWYRWVVGPRERVQSGLVSNEIAVGTEVFKPEAKYPVHNHPYWELYFVLKGEGVFVKNDRRYDIMPGDFIIVRPYDPHGLKNTSKRKPLKILWICWQEGNVKLDITHTGGQPINPVKCWRDQESACLSPVPTPPPLTGKDADKYLVGLHLTQTNET